MVLGQEFEEGEYIAGSTSLTNVFSRRFPSALDLLTCVLLFLGELPLVLVVTYVVARINTFESRAPPSVSLNFLP
jgi:hypothetical protein